MKNRIVLASPLFDCFGGSVHLTEGSHRLCIHDPSESLPRRKETGLDANA